MSALSQSDSVQPDPGHPAAEELMTLALDPEAVRAGVVRHVAGCVLCRAESERWGAFLAERRTVSTGTSSRGVLEFGSGGGREHAGEDEQAPALVQRILAATTRQDLSLRGDLRLIRRFVVERLACSPGLRLIAASLLLHLFLVLPISAFVLARRARPDLLIRIAEPNTELPFAKDVPEPDWAIPEPIVDEFDDMLEFPDPRRAAPDATAAASLLLRRRAAGHLRDRMPRPDAQPGALQPQAPGLAAELERRSRIVYAGSSEEYPWRVELPVPSDSRGATDRLLRLIRAESALDEHALKDVDVSAWLASCCRVLAEEAPPNEKMERLEAALYARVEGAGLATAQMRARYFLLRSRLVRSHSSAAPDVLLDPALRAAEPLSAAWLDAFRQAIGAGHVSAKDKAFVSRWLADVE